MNKKIGIITIQNAYNYGSTLQAYALQTFLSSAGFDAEIIDYQNTRLNAVYRTDFSNETKEIIDLLFHGHIRSSFITYKNLKEMMAKNLYRSVHKEYEDYRKEKLKLSTIIDDKHLEVLNKYDTIITGSDQVWNKNIVGADKIYYIDIPGFDGQKIAYAVSGSIEGNPEVIELIKDIHYISVRERSLAEECWKHCGIRAEIVCDPTLLLSKEEWTKEVYKIPEKYIFAYLMWDEPVAIDYLKNLSKEKGLPLAVIHRMQPSVEINGKKYSTCTPADFLSLIYNAEYVVNNSFHGTVFSVIFQKQFLSFDSGQRVHEFLDRFGLHNRTIDSDIDSEIDWEYITESMNKEKERGSRFLFNAINSKR